MWCYSAGDSSLAKKGGMPSSKEHCDAVAEIAGVPVEELFPLYTEKFLIDEKH